MKKYVGIDLGGTNIALGIVTQEGEICSRTAVLTKAGRPGQKVMKDIISAVYRLLEESGCSLAEIESIGIGVPGTANKETGILEYANNLRMDGIPFIRVLTAEFNKKVLFENDAKAAAWAEYRLGMGRGTKSFVMITLGTGVGGALILDGKIYQGCNYASGELGHMVIKAGGRQCSCGRRGCLEAYASVTALVAMARERMTSRSLLFELCSGDMEQLNGKIIFAGVRKGDSLAKELLGEYTKALAAGCANIINILQPEVLCIGGGISRAGDLFIEPLRALIDEAVYTREARTQSRVVVAALHNDAGIIGAALLER